MEFIENTKSAIVLLSFIDLERGGFGEILHEVMIFPEGLCPEGNIITEGQPRPRPSSLIYIF